MASAEMIERVADAIRRGLGPLYDPDFETAAQEVIEELREPTEAMIKAGNDWDCAPLSAESGGQ